MPNWKAEISEKLARLEVEPTREAEIVEELSQHFEDRYQEMLSGGANIDQAYRLLLAELNESELPLMELQRIAGRSNPEAVVLGGKRKSSMLADLWQDVGYGIRSMRRQPGFTAVAIATLALGIGPITAIFTLAHSVLFKPLPYKEPDRLVRIWKNVQGERDGASVPDFVDWRDQNRVFESMGTFSIYSVFNLSGEGAPQAIQGSVVSADMLSTLGVQPELGRLLLYDEDRSGASPVVVLSQSLWQERFDADPNIIGRTLTLNAQKCTVVGVMPKGFEFPIQPAGTQLWANTVFDPNDPENARSENFLNVVARLKRDASMKQAEADLQSIVQTQYKDQIGIDLMPLREELVGDTRMPLLVLLGAIAFVLLIACANVANLLLVRSAARQKEVAIRTALGASRSRLFRQLLTESVLLSMLGGALGLALGVLTLNLLLSFSPIRIPRLTEVGIDGRVLSFLLLVVALIGAIFGTLSAFRISDSDLRESLKEGTGRATSGRSRQRLRSTLVTTEIALSLVLLIGAGLMLRSFLKLIAVEPGLRSEGVLCVNVTLPGSRYRDASQQSSFIRGAIESMRGLPQARSVGCAAFHPWTMAGSTPQFEIEGAPATEPGQEPAANYISISPEYHSTLGIPLLAGRSFSSQDDGGGAPVAVVNQSFARRFFPNDEALGQRIRFYNPAGTQQPAQQPPQQPWMEIVGVVGDVRQRLESPAEPEIQVPLAQNAWPFMTFFVRCDGNPSSVASAARSAIQSVDKDQPVAWITTLDEVLVNATADRRGMMVLLGAFAAVALVLAAVGVYGIISHAVSQRTREIGVRLALGAQAADVFKLILRQGVILMLAGLCVGLPGAILLTRVVSGMLFEVTTTDVATFVGVSILLGAVALLACYIPARRATKVDPIVALRCE